ncbi:MAG: SDR family oxidoreductase [Desulfuromonadales bacterium]|nr:SDR family oxidoreductase [Desulfuromonadales bacterium]
MDNANSSLNVEGKVVLITGASRGLGKAVAMGFAKAGAKLSLAARNEELLNEVAAEAKEFGAEALTVKCDVGVESDLVALVEKTVERFGRIDVLVNNAGISPWVSRSHEVTTDMWKDLLQINVVGCFILSREVGKVMLGQGGGSIINMASLGGMLGMPGQVAYSATKGALIQMTKTLAVEWARKNITVNALAPTFLATDLTADLISSDKHSKPLLARIPMGKFGVADDVVGAALFLASDSASYVTGTVIPIDGGTLAC